MALLKILIAPDKRLLKKSMPVEIFDKNLKDFAADLIETINNEQASGIASIQVEDDPRFKYDSIPDGYRPQPSIVIINIDELIVAVNPKIIAHNNEMKCNSEGCLSVPNLRIDIERYTKVTVEYQDLNGKTHTKEYDKWNAICWQHEIDHLNGILAPERAPGMQKLLLWKKFEQINKQIKYRR